ncbi:MAG TPA: hypothetical protein VLV50_18975 [Stellaceae bacterium]|nr:hypothetical protein [Stellaceae bacterium]
MALDPWITRENIKRYHRLLQSQTNSELRAKLEVLIEEEERKLPLLEKSDSETRRKIKRWQDKAEELRRIADRTEDDKARTTYRQAADNYAKLARDLEAALLCRVDGPAKDAG